ncbi:unnamed protein product, partial [Meganyctiphanes norvegica]
VGEGMGGSVSRPVHDSMAQRFATEPAPQTAVEGSTAVLPCRVINKSGHLQWTKDGFGLGTERNLAGFSRYSMIGSNDEGDFSLSINPVLLKDDALFQCQVSAVVNPSQIRNSKWRQTIVIRVFPCRLRKRDIQYGSGVIFPTDRTAKKDLAPSIQWVDDSA